MRIKRVTRTFATQGLATDLEEDGEQLLPSAALFLLHGGLLLQELLLFFLGELAELHSLLRPAFGRHGEDKELGTIDDRKLDKG